MRILWLDSVDSTQRYLIEALKRGELHAPVCVVAKMQTGGRGSRGNSWEGLPGNLFFSFALLREQLPDDLKLESSSIYFTYLLKETLEEMGSKLWLKWPNDFYKEHNKIGGAITNLYKGSLVCGIGMNIKNAPEGFGTLDIDIKQGPLLEIYFEKLAKKISWKHIFSKYRLEFDKSRTYFTHHSDLKVSLDKAILLEDGSIECEGQRIFSLR